MASARLQPAGAAWTAPESSVFADQTTAPGDFAAVLGFDCSWAAWTGNRMGAVIQATDQPDPPYSEDRTVDLLVTAPTAGEGAETATDQLAIPALEAAGGRNVGLAEPSHGSPVSVYYLVSPLRDTIFVAVGPEDVFDPIAQLPSGTASDRDLGQGGPVRFVDPSEPHPTTAAGFACNGYGWTSPTVTASRRPRWKPSDRVR